MSDLDSLLHVIIVGAMKSGTSSLYNYIGQHKNVCMSMKKETDYFARGREKVRSLEAYRENWLLQSHEQTHLLEASPTYTNICLTENSPTPAEEMKALGLQPKIIYIMRDPVRRIESQIQHSLELGWDKPPYCWMSYDIENPIIDPRLVDPSKYASQIETYYNCFPIENIHLIKFEKLISDTQSEISQCLRFLGLEDTSESFIYSVLNTAHDRMLPDFLKEALHNPTIQSFKRALPSKWTNPLKRAFSKPRRKSIKLTEAQLEKVNVALMPEIKMLRELYRFDTSGWSIS